MHGNNNVSRFEILLEPRGTISFPPFLFERRSRRPPAPAILTTRNHELKYERDIQVTLLPLFVVQRYYAFE